MKTIFLISILVVASASAAFAQKAYSPKPGSPERAAIMNAIRAYDAKRDANLTNELFAVAALRLQGNWAYANVEQQVAGDNAPYGQAHVFLQKSRGEWRVAFSTYNDSNEVGVDGLARLRRMNRSFPKDLQHLQWDFWLDDGALLR